MWQAHRVAVLLVPVVLVVRVRRWVITNTINNRPAWRSRTPLGTDALAEAVSTVHAVVAFLMGRVLDAMDGIDREGYAEFQSLVADEVAVAQRMLFMAGARISREEPEVMLCVRLELVHKLPEADSPLCDAFGNAVEALVDLVNDNFCRLATVNDGKSFERLVRRIPIFRTGAERIAQDSALLDALDEFHDNGQSAYTLTVTISHE